MKNIGSLLAIVCLVINVNAQERNRPAGDHHSTEANGHLYGRIVDGKTNKGIEAASVRLFIILKDNAGQTKDSHAGGMLSKPNGDFSVENLPVGATYRINITAIGFKELGQQITFSRNAGG